MKIKVEIDETASIFKCVVCKKFFPNEEAIGMRTGEDDYVEMCYECAPISLR